MSDSILFYVSGHGHARRTAQVIKALQTRRPDVDIHVRTTAAARIFAPLPPERIVLAGVDAGMAEDDALTINPSATLQNLETLIGRRDATVEQELAVVRSLQPGLIVADVPFMAGHVADAAGVPCVAVSNFTWDWICQPLFSGDERYASRFARLLPVMRDGYTKMRAALQLPFGGFSDAFRQVIPVPLVAVRSSKDRAVVLSRAGLDPADTRPRVLIGMRGGVPEATVVAAVADAGDFLFITPDVWGSADLPANLRAVPTGAEMDFSDLVSICDIVISKLGYGTVAECIAAGARMLWPRRTGFFEDEVMTEMLPRYLPALEISRDDYRAGRWAGRLRALVSQPPAQQRMRTDGAEVCAKFLEQALSGVAFDD